MSLSKNLASLLQQHKSEIALIQDFVKRTEQSLARCARSSLNRKRMTEAQLRGLELFADGLKKAIDGKGPISLTLDEDISDLVLSAVKPIKHKGFLSEMSLAYLVTYFEAFIKDTVKCILTHRPSMLMNVNNVAFAEIYQVRSMKALKQNIAEKEANKLGYGNIDDVKVYFEKKMNIGLDEYDSWDELREIVFRRNIIVHNSAITNSAYCRATGYPHKGKHMNTSPKYVVQAYKNIDGFFDYCHKCVRSKFKISPSQNSLRKLD